MAFNAAPGGSDDDVFDDAATPSTPPPVNDGGGNVVLSGGGNDMVYLKELQVVSEVRMYRTPRRALFDYDDERS